MTPDRNRQNDLLQTITHSTHYYERPTIQGMIASHYGRRADNEFIAMVDGIMAKHKK